MFPIHLFISLFYCICLIIVMRAFVWEIFASQKKLRQSPSKSKIKQVNYFLPCTNFVSSSGSSDENKTRREFNRREYSTNENFPICRYPLSLLPDHLYLYSVLSFDNILEMNHGVQVDGAWPLSAYYWWSRHNKKKASLDYGNRCDCCMYFCNLQTSFLPTAITIPILIVVGSIVSAGNQFNLRSFPPERCINGRANYLNYVLPINAVIMIVNTLLVTIAWVIHKVSWCKW